MIELIGAHLPSHVDFHLISTFTGIPGTRMQLARNEAADLSRQFVFFLAFSPGVDTCPRTPNRVSCSFCWRGKLAAKGNNLHDASFPPMPVRSTFSCSRHKPISPWLPQLCRRMLLWGISGAGRVIVLTHFWHDYYSSLLDLTSEPHATASQPSRLAEICSGSFRREKGYG